MGIIYSSFVYHMWESGCLTSHSGFIIDSNGNLWHWIHGKENEMKMVQGDNMPFLVSVCANDTLLVALDEYGCVWRTQLNPFIDVKLFRQDNYCDIISIFISPTQNCFYVMDMNGILWKDIGTRKKLVHPGLPPLVSCCINSLSGGIDINGFLWIWKSGKYFEKKRCFILSIFQNFKISKQVENILLQLIFMEIFG